MKNTNKKAFSLLETLIASLIFTSIIISLFFIFPQVYKLSLKSFQSLYNKNEYINLNNLFYKDKNKILKKYNIFENEEFDSSNQKIKWPILIKKNDINMINVW